MDGVETNHAGEGDDCAITVSTDIQYGNIGKVPYIR